MKKDYELLNFFRESMLPDLRGLEAKRKSIAGGIWIEAALLAVLIAFAFLSGTARVGGYGVYILIAGAAWLIWSGISIYGKYSEFKSEFKQEIIFRLIRFIDPGLSYSKDSCLPYPLFLESNIFLTQVDRYGGDDYVTGKIGETKLEFSEVHAEHKTETTDSKGNRQTQWTTIFKGLFVVADFNKNFAGRTVVLPDIAEGILGFLGSMLQKMNFARGQLIKLEDPEFEKLFAVYGDDQVTARYLLTPGLMQKMTEYRLRTGKNVYFSFADSKLFIAVSYTKNLFEPKLFGALVDFNLIKEYYSDLELAAGVVEEFDLNTRIWSKE